VSHTQPATGDWFLCRGLGFLYKRPVDSWMARLAQETEAALSTTPLPESPDHARVADFLHRARSASAAASVAA
ncbi:hypothetical protein ACFXPJ_38375, partial [Streptomyces goshikiensis]